MNRLAFLFVSVLSLAGMARAQQTGPTPASTHKLSSGIPVAAAKQIVITADEWQELRTARSAAIKANPDLVAENTKLMEKIRTFEEKLNAAMVKTDPAIAPTLTKFEAERQRTAAPSTPPPIGPPSTAAAPPPAK